MYRNNEKLTTLRIKLGQSQLHLAHRLFQLERFHIPSPLLRVLIGIRLGVQVMWQYDVGWWDIVVGGLQLYGWTCSVF